LVPERYHQFKTFASQAGIVSLAGLLFLLAGLGSYSGLLIVAVFASLGLALTLWIRHNDDGDKGGSIQ